MAFYSYLMCVKRPLEIAVNRAGNGRRYTFIKKCAERRTQS